MLVRPGLWCKTIFKQTIFSALVLATIATPLSLTAGVADAQEYYGRPWHDNRGWGGAQPEWLHHHRDYGGVIAGGLAAGLVGALIGTAIENSGPRYYAPPPPRLPECWHQRQTVQDRYDEE